MSFVNMADANGAPVKVFVVPAPDGQSVLPAHAFVQLPADFSVLNDTVAQGQNLPSGTAAPNTFVRTVVANPNRIGGFVQAGAQNVGKITVTMPHPGGGNPIIMVLGKGDTFPLSPAPGRVLQQAFTITGDTAGDTLQTVEYA